MARVEDGSEEPIHYVMFGTGAAISRVATEEPAVTLSVAKRPGSNAITVARAVLAQVDRLKGTTIPGDVAVSITRHYGASAAEKSNELLLHMAIAVVGVSLLVLFMLGWRESIVVAIAIPSTLSLMLLLFHLLGYTLNRVTLFALTFSIGILVDDAIVVVENIVRHRRLKESKHRSLPEIAVQAVAEVGNPTVLATLTVIAAILPMAFLGGLNGPYLRPIPVGASAAMVFSLLVAFAVTPWAAARLLGLRHRGGVSAPLRENLYVTGDVAGGSESPAYAIFKMNKAVQALEGDVAIYNATQPPSDARPAIKWDGEWDITLELFRDLGRACAVVMLLIYGMLVGWFRSFSTPLVIMAPIPFSLVGILPAHAALGAFFTATSLIGFMAGAGIVVRNSIILIDFAEDRIREGMPLEHAVVEAGAVRFRPMLLTALAVIVGSAVILFDPIFQGLALSLAAGEVASLLISRMAVPILYAMVHRRRRPGVEDSIQAASPLPSPTYLREWKSSDSRPESVQSSRNVQ